MASQKKRKLYEEMRLLVSRRKGGNEKEGIAKREIVHESKENETDSLPQEEGTETGTGISTQRREAIHH